MGRAIKCSVQIVAFHHKKDFASFNTKSTPLIVQELATTTMQSCPTLKRSMPCNDLITMGAKETFALEASMFLDDATRKILRGGSERKRLRLSESPATAALEQALAIEDNEDFYDDGGKTVELDSFNLPLFSTCEVSLFKDLSKNHSMSCKHQRKKMIPSVHSMNDISHVMARLTTSA